MEPIYPFEHLLVFAGLGMFLLIGVILRAKIKFFQNFLIPSCLIGGLIAMVLINAKIIPVSHDILETFVYHLFNISFISLGLMPGALGGKSKTSGVEKAKAPLGLGLVEGVVFPFQVVIGGLMTILFVYLGFQLFPTFGFLSPLGFIEGPGQALSLGHAWEQIAAIYTNAATVGLTFATIGFFFAFFVGVPLVNWGIRKGLSSETPVELPADFRKGVTSKEQEKELGGLQTTHSGNIDSLAFQAALVGFVFVLTYGLVKLLAGFFPPDLVKTFWGFFFFFGLVVALGIRGLMEKIGIGYLIDRNFQKRISGWAVDFLIVATVAAIQLRVVMQYLAPIIAISLVTGTLTLLVIFYLGKRIWSDYNLERTAGIFGTCTGTVPTGLLLVRIADPEFQTPVAVELGIMMIFAAPFIFTGMLLVNAPVLWGWSTGLTVLVFAGMTGIALALLKVFGLWGEPQF